MKKFKSKMISLTIVFAILLFAFGVVAGGLIINNYTQKEISEKEEVINDISNELNNNKNLLYSIKEELGLTKEDLTIETSKSNELQEKLNSVNEELDIVNTTLADLKDKEYELLYFGDFKITHYCNEFYEHICGHGDGLTATGTNVTPGRTIAVDPKVIPYGTKVYIEGYGWRVAEDCGGSVKTNHIDVAVNLHSEASALGVKHRDVWILVEKGS